MKHVKQLILILLACFLLCGCDDLQQLLDTAEGALPKFQGGVPNLIAGTWVCKSSIDNTYWFRLTLKSDKSFLFEYQDNSQIKGTYTFSYDHLDLLKASGSVVFSEVLDPDRQLKKTFSYEADVEKGPQTLVLAGVEYEFVQR